jgi:multiple sugar transport system substrate-binding protein
MSVDRKVSKTANVFPRRHSRRNVLKGGALGAAAAISPQVAHTALGAPSSSSSSGRSHAQDAVTLQVTVWLGDPEFKAMEELAAVFTETHPNVTVEFINIVDGGPWGRDKLQQMIAGGTAPDLMMMNTGQFEAFGARDALADLDERIAAEQFDLGIYWPPAVEGCKLDGKLYGLPKDISDHVVYINTDLFADAGVELPTSEWDWDEFREVAKQLTLDKDGDGAVDQWGTSINNAAWCWGAFVHSNGGQILNDDRTECLLTSEEAKVALEYYFGLLTTDEVSVPPGTLPQTPGSGDQFLGGITAMHMAGPWFRPGLVENEPFNWTIRLFPRVPGSTETPVSVLYVDQWAMSSTTDNPDEAWELLKFLGGPEGHNAWAEIYGSRSINPIQEIATGDAWLGYGGEEHLEDNQLILDQLEVTVPPPTNFADGAEVENVWNEQLELVMVGQQDVATAVQTITDTINPTLQMQAP